MLINMKKETLALLIAAAFCPTSWGEVEFINPDAVQCTDPMQQCYNTWSASVKCQECRDDGLYEGAGSSSVATDEGTALDAAKSDCINNLSKTGSDIDNFTFNHLHYATDFSLATQSSGCVPCGGGGKGEPTVRDSTLHIRRIQSLRESTQPASFGPGCFLNYDFTLSIFSVNDVTYVDCFNPEWLGARRFSSSGNQFYDVIYHSAKGLTLFDESGSPTTNITRATRAVYYGKSGNSVTFELFDLGGGRKGGRMIETHAASGKKILSFAYVHPVDAQDAASELKWLKSSATDAQGGRVAFVHSVLPNGNSVISRIQTPSGDLNYAYDTSGNLSVVTYPNGDRSTLAREIENGLLKIRFSEAGAGGAHRITQQV